MEAGTGIEPVFTDLQSQPFPPAVKDLGAAPYQDKACTGREPDTLIEGLENENPGALAGATGAGWKARHFRSAEYRKRAEAATSLCLAIAECEREDAVVIMSAALADMAIGSPLPVWINARDDARWWASYATEIELKAYAAAAFEALRPKARLAFLDHVQRRVAA